MSPVVFDSERPRVLLVDDEPAVTQGIKDALRKEPVEIECANSGEIALAKLASGNFDVVVSDERMPGLQGSELLSLVRQQFPNVARIILSGQASLDAALRAINSAEIFRFLIKPCTPQEILNTIQDAIVARDGKRKLEEWASKEKQKGKDEFQDSFERDLKSLWIGFQPIVRSSSREIFGFEALLRCHDSICWNPQRLLSIARRLGRGFETGRRIRKLIAEQLALAPKDAVVFVNVDPEDLDDAELVDGHDDIARSAKRIVLEITERESLKITTELECKLRKLRSLGYHIAVDDLGAGYAGLTSLASILPDFVKFDMDLIRGIDRSVTKQKLVGAMAKMCHELGIQTLAEGVETHAECDTVVALGCQFLQGYLFGQARAEFSMEETSASQSLSLVPNWPSRSH
ncbi:MAG: EAL domain-containing protein [Planctomycetes bacterium]|nr:EAL domain-containing protein [Planctomycetota bacterium]